MASSSEETRYRLLLDKLAEELTPDEVDDLVFLLRFSIEGKRNRISIHGDPRKLLTELQKQNYIGAHNLTILSEVFRLIDRYDLIREIEERLGNSPAESCQISPFIRTLWKFGQRLSSDDLKKSKFRLEWDKEKEDIKKAWQLFEKAFERGHLEKDDFNKLKEFADTIGQSKTLESVMDPDSILSGFASSHLGVEDGPKKNIHVYRNTNDSHGDKTMHNELHLSVKKPKQMVSRQHFMDTGSSMTLAQKAEIAQLMPNSLQMTLAQRAELFKSAKPRQNQMTLAEKAAVTMGDGTGQMTLADKAKLAMNIHKMQQDQHVSSTRGGMYPSFGDVPDHMEQSHSKDLVYHYTEPYNGRDHTQSPYNLHYQQQFSFLSPDDLSISPLIAQPDIHTAQLALPSKIPENHTQPNTYTSLMKPSEDIQREEERSDSQKEPSEEIHLAERISSLNLSRSHQNIHNATNSKTIQNAEANTEQMSITSNEVTLTLEQPDQNETGEFSQSSNMGKSAHHENLRSDEVPIYSARNSHKSSYDGDKRDGQNVHVTRKEEVTLLKTVEKVKHEEDETKQGSEETKQGSEETKLGSEETKQGSEEIKQGSVESQERLPHQELQECVLEPSATLSTFEEHKVNIPRDPRCGRIIPMKVEEMKKYIGQEIGRGSFGIVYKAKMTEGDDRKFAIKTISVTNELFQKSYEKEIHNGRILHPFINPIIARAEDLSERVLYLMYPYMENGDLRHNIDLEKDGKKLCTKGYESNSQIWTRCIYQIVHAVDYLHKPVTSSFRGPIFHQDLTSRNIFLDGHFNVKIGDFGIAVEAKQNATSATRTRIQGTHGYHPPKMNLEKYNASYDIFSVGVVILEILSGDEAKLKGKPEYLYEKYGCEGGYEDLIDDLEERAKNIKSAEWIKTDRQNDLAKIALECVDQDEDRRKGVDLLQKLDEMKLNPKERYLLPSILDKCVSCYVNRPAKLPLKGKDCAGSNTNSPCRPFCLHCLMNNHINPLVCPQHGKTRPPFGDHVYGVFVAGNNVMGMEQFSYSEGQSKNTEAVAQTFIKDAEKVVQVLTAKYPFVLGASAEHLKIVKPNNPGYDVNMETSIREAFENMNSAIKKALKENDQNPENDRLPNSLFIFYFSGHCSEENGLFLGNTEETLKATIKGTQKATTKFIMEMLHEQLGVDHVLVILDCCHARSQHFDKYELNVDKVNKRKETSILQLSSCDTSEKSVVMLEGSLFTNFLCLGLQGMGSEELGGDTIICCAECEKRRKNRKDMNIELPCVKYHYNCVSDHGVTYTSLRDFVEGHFDLLRAGKTSNSGTMTPVSSAHREKKFFIAYYNPNKSHIPIHLKGSKADHMYCLSSHPETMDKLRKDIISYTLSGTGDMSCDVLTFYRSYGQESYRLIAIHVMYGRDKDEELTNLESIEKAWSCSHELVACVREDVKRLSHGPVKLNNINKSIVTSSQANYDSEILNINQDYIEIAGGSVSQADKLLRDIKQSASGLHENFLSLIQEVLKTTRSIQNESLILEKIKGNLLRFYLYDDFSVLDIQRV
ncbi:hypothetical protein CHS0354_013557 [Potamilus streckersoni]|uniref:Uncharacterized protein n=1 Tax=Potamilus streckersoni TaxID=2493646 RepID=A0AAE0SKD4_9BIVA|nr:hypothetical protein CHS0354_013557 [Potamilus streckersoni]